MIRLRSLSAVIARHCVASVLFAALLATAVLPAHAQTPDEAARAAERARAEALEAEGKALRAEAEATYEATVPGCYDRLFVNRCIDQAKKKRLETVQRARALEAESRRITLAERQRVAAEAGAKADRPLTPAAPNALPATPATQPAAPSADTRIAPAPEAERIRAEREANTRAAETEAASKRATADAERAAERRQAEEAAAARARQAAEDRARYDERIRKYEAEQAQKKK
ncbi:MAG: hypothetical protein E6Q92_09000 [Burkholderiaceae bacterium]|nr:MAG: hypothetical protein E6Q92_09000 [Burkholderiaceae bacterium]